MCNRMYQFKNWAVAMIVLGTALSANVQAANSPSDQFGGDPQQSMQWPSLRAEFFKPSDKVEFDERVKIDVPPYAEDAMNVPVTLDASAIEGVKKVVVLVDRNPIRKVLEYIPIAVRPTLNFRFKLQQASPIRVAALGADNVWHVGSTFIEAAGGGCTVPGATRADGSWPKTLGRVASRLFDPNHLRNDTRLRLQVSHPMDTGLVEGIPAFYIQELVLQDSAGQPLAKIYPFEPISENPLFSFDFYTPPKGEMKLVGHDNNGNEINAQVQ